MGLNELLGRRPRRPRVENNGFVYELTDELAATMLGDGLIAAHPEHGDGWYLWTFVASLAALEQVGVLINDGSGTGTRLNGEPNR